MQGHPGLYQVSLHKSHNLFQKIQKGNNSCIMLK